MGDEADRAPQDRDKAPRLTITSLREGYTLPPLLLRPRRQLALLGITHLVLAFIVLACVREEGGRGRHYLNRSVRL